MNTEGITLTQACAAPEIWWYRDNWRQRLIEVKEHPTDPTKVISVGYPFDQTQDPIICVEQLTDYERIIDGQIRKVD